MNLKKLRSFIGSHWHNIPGWRTDRKIVVFESDDWGSIRMPSREVYNKLLNKGIRVDNCPFTKFDSLASEEDLSALYETLLKFKDFKGNNPIFTVNTIVANPDFEKIKKSAFSEYHFELFTETLKRYPKHSGSFELWKQGINLGIIHPQLHGREHLNVMMWLKYLKQGSKETRIAFENNMFGISTTISSEKRWSYMTALDYENNTELSFQNRSLIEAQDIFRKLFTYNSESFIATNYTWSSAHEAILNLIGIRFLQGSQNQILPIGDNQKNKYRKHFLGQYNDLLQLYLVRNCFFEPSENPQKDTVSECLKQIKTAFFCKKPAIIGTHRFNYIGFINEANRKVSLRKLDELLKKITREWPDVEFMTSDGLGQLIHNIIKNG